MLDKYDLLPIKDSNNICKFVLGILFEAVKLFKKLREGKSICSLSERNANVRKPGLKV